MNPDLLALRNLRHLLIACLLWVIALWVIAPGVATAQTITPQITVESVLRYLQKDLFISPGIGFRKVQIGQSFDQVARSWGYPNKKHESTEAGVSTTWIYIVDKDSQIAVAGGTNVTTIRVLGSLNSPFSSSEGAQFGMSPHQVITIYGAPRDQGNLTTLSYPEKGIAFAFEHGVLIAMQVTSPKP